MKKLLFTILLSVVTMVSCDKEYHAPLDPSVILRDYAIGYWSIDDQKGKGYCIEEDHFYPGDLQKIEKGYVFRPGPTFTLLSGIDSEKRTYELDNGEMHFVFSVWMGENGKLEVTDECTTDGTIRHHTCTRATGTILFQRPSIIGPGY